MGNLIKVSFFVLLANLSFGQISFFNYYSNNGVDKGEGIVQLEDSSYVVTGSSSSFSASSQALLLKVDSLGNFLWSNHYGGTESESGRRVLYKKSIGFYIAGFTNSIGNGGFDYYLVKTDTNGVFEWEKSYGGAGWEKVNDAVMTIDTGIMMVGESSSNIYGTKDIYIVKTDQYGDTLWTRTIGDSGDDIAHTIKELNDTTYIVAGEYYNVTSSLTKSWAMQIRNDGTIDWELNFGSAENSRIKTMYFNGTDILLFGTNYGAGLDGLNGYFAILNMSGVYALDFVWNGPGDKEFVHMTRFGSMNNIYAIQKVQNQWSYAIGNDLAVEKYDNSFTLSTYFTIAHEGDDVANQIIPTSDGTAIIVGYTTNVISGGNEIYLCKIGPNDAYPDVAGAFGTNNVVTVVENEFNDNVRVYPNPSSGKVNIFTDNNAFEKISVVSLNGQHVMEVDFSLTKELDFNELQNGVYILLIEGEGVVARKRIVVQH